MFSRSIPFLFAVALLAGQSARAAETVLDGAWLINAHFGDDSVVARMTLATADGKIEGTSGPLDENGYFPLILRGAAGKDAAELDVLSRATPAGHLTLRRSARGLAGAGTLFGVPVTLEAHRPQTSIRPPKTFDVPPAFHLYYSGRNAPLLRLVPGDTVKTTTLDNEGQDQALQWKAMPGNSLTGPFYVEGAMPGDTLVVHLDRVALNRDSAKMYSRVIDQKAVQGGYVQTPANDWDRTWILDRQKGVARLAKPGAKLDRLEVPLRPMIGSIGVAPPMNQSLSASDIGFHGGNLDFQRLTSGATLYLPVFRAGALLSLGDGHALQGDGEISGQGLETSLDVQFTIALIPGWSLGQVWSEDAEAVMVSGIDNSLEASLQMATTGMARWLKHSYGLNDSEVAALLSASVEYQIAEVVDPRPHVVAKLSKKTIAMLRKP